MGRYRATALTGDLVRRHAARARRPRQSNDCDDENAQRKRNAQAYNQVTDAKCTRSPSVCQPKGQPANDGCSEQSKACIHWLISKQDTRETDEQPGHPADPKQPRPTFR